MQIFRFKLANYRYAFLLEMYSRQCWQMQWKLLLINFLETFRKVFYTKYVKKEEILKTCWKESEVRRKLPQPSNGVSTDIVQRSHLIPQIFESIYFHKYTSFIFDILLDIQHSFELFKLSGNRLFSPIENL